MNYCSAKYESIIIKDDLKKNIVFAEHNLVTDPSFAEMDIIICRNVLIYFNKELQSRSIGIFHDSLVRKGILCLGSKESLRFSLFADNFNELVAKEKIYQKVK